MVDLGSLVRCAVCELPVVKIGGEWAHSPFGPGGTRLTDYLTNNEVPWPHQVEV